ncbi:gliding motility-associated C-terminal domain-containing protein [Dyadobacter sp. CY343]|uniref:T9SS type B sorting domain-containing protein n=1 Tax=Dyadobacter sp. CY343 TaxID=2907299 RepID=UPI001F175859|nr:gliding motility-associated C-terminal domain-containing protein [Dyadobacter sp. CY343]MCE7062580.1 gliding motility-associated C-terminal domain-containing protein [Dyadobacter sp. CY343]
MRLLLPLQFFVFIFLCLFNTSVNAQGLCDRGGGGFDINVTEGCAPLSVRVVNTVPNAIAIGYTQFYDGASFTPSLQDISNFRYATPGTFTLLQQVAISTGRVYECKKITVYETAAITAQYTSCGGGKVTISLVNNAVLPRYDQVEIQWGDGQTFMWQKGSALTIDHTYTNTSASPVVKFTGQYAAGKACSQGNTFSLPISFQQAQLNEIEVKALEMRGDGTLRVNYQGVVAIPTEIKYSANGNTYTTAGTRSSGGVQPFDIQNLNAKQTYQVKLSSADLCQGARDSKIYASMALSGESSEGKNILKWNQYPIAEGFTGYDLVKDGTILKSFTSIADVTYTDEEVECGSYSDYHIVAKIGDVTSTSAPVGVRTEISNPRPIEKASVSVLGDNIVTIKASVPGSGPNSSYDMTIERAEAGTSTFKKIITLYNDSEYSDITVKTNEMSYCYRMSYQNSCGQKLPPSQPVCTMLLKKDFVSLGWTPELPVLGGITGYEVVQRGTSSGETIIPTQMNTQYTIQLSAQSDLEYNFQIRATSPDGDFESLSNIINYRRSAGVFVPDAFSPNGDGYNDVLEAKSTQLQAFTFSVMNRWGQVVFHSEDINTGWDGTIKGENAPVGSYVYKMTFVDDINQTVEKSGTFMLLR